MSLRPEVSPAIPEETVRVARASFPKGSRYTRLRDELGAVFDDARFAGLFPARGRPAEAPWRLALVTLFQLAEGLPDRQAAEAVRGRIDWKYALALPLTDPGFDSTVLSEFRSRLVEGRAEQGLLDAVLALARERNLLSGGGRQRTDSTHVLAAVRALNRRSGGSAAGCFADGSPRGDSAPSGRCVTHWKAWPSRRLIGCGRMPSLTGPSVTGTAPWMTAWRRTQPAGRSAPGP